MLGERITWLSRGGRIAVACLVSIFMAITQFQTAIAQDVPEPGPSGGALEAHQIGQVTLENEPQASGTVIVKANVALNSRKGPHSGYYDVNGSYPRNQQLTVECRTYGETLTGTVRKSRVWYRVSSRKYISQAYVDIVKEPHVCSETKVNDYPHQGDCPPTGGGPENRDQWGYTRGQCTSFAAWRGQQRLGVNLGGLGNARDWNNNFSKTGTMPLVGSIAVAEGGVLGHVAYVAQVNADGTFTVEEYNWSGPCKYGVRTGLSRSSNGFSSFIYP